MANPISASEKCALNQLYRRYRQAAKRRQYRFDIKLGYFTKLVAEKCFYCGARPAQVFKRRNAFVLYNGIDRLRSESGYTMDNTVTCCNSCNRLKSDLSLDRFIHQISQVAINFLGLKK